MYSPTEKRILDLMIKQKLGEKGDIVLDAETSDAEFFSAMTDICTLNKLRDANNDT